jgi:hypothetical protein
MPSQLLCIDLLEWYNSIVGYRQQEKKEGFATRRTSSPALRKTPSASRCLAVAESQEEPASIELRRGEVWYPHPKG